MARNALARSPVFAFLEANLVPPLGNLRLLARADLLEDMLLSMPAARSGVLSKSSDRFRA
jgi:hypothetical protein